MSNETANIPKITREQAIALFERSGRKLEEFPAGVMLSIRGYYRDSKGQAHQNDFGIFDDVLCWIGNKANSFICIPGNTDPSKVGYNSSLGKPYAMLCAGLWFFRRGEHKGRSYCFRQLDPAEAKIFGAPNQGQFTVYRAKSQNELLQHIARIETGYFAINMHDAPNGDLTDGGTSSWGCLTAPSEIFFPWSKQIWQETREYKQDLIPNFLVENPPGAGLQLLEMLDEEIKAKKAK